VIVPGADGFDWSSAGIAVAAFVGLLVVSIAVMSAIRGGRYRRLNRRK
jgi:heme exporter protein D